MGSEDHERHPEDVSPLVSKMVYLGHAWVERAPQNQNSQRQKTLHLPKFHVHLSTSIVLTAYHTVNPWQLSLDFCGSDMMETEALTLDTMTGKWTLLWLGRRKFISACLYWCQEPWIFCSWEENCRCLPWLRGFLNLPVRWLYLSVCKLWLTF